MRIKELIEFLKTFDQELRVGVHYQLNDWPGDSWEFLTLDDAKVVKPIELTKTGSASKDATIPALIFSV